MGAIIKSYKDFLVESTGNFHENYDTPKLKEESAFLKADVSAILEILHGHISPQIKALKSLSSEISAYNPRSSHAEYVKWTLEHLNIPKFIQQLNDAEGVIKKAADSLRAIDNDVQTVLKNRK